MDAGVVPTGDLSSSWETSIGKPTKVAELLAAARDNDAKQAGGIPSKMIRESVKCEGKTLMFQMVSELGTISGISLKRVTLVRAVLLPNKTYLTAFASSPEDVFTGELKARLEYALSSFVPRVPEASSEAKQLLGR